MRIHKEGQRLLTITGIFLLLVNLVIMRYADHLSLYILALSLIVFGFLLYFFRNPKRNIQESDNSLIYAPADGKVVAIEQVEETEYFNDKRIQVSIFMSPTNVHVNRNPVGGKINYYKYHPGKYHVAWHPKSSTDNERTTVVIHNGKKEILLRQIAGFMARRIVSYVKEGMEVDQGSDMGFIKFGSRVDLFLPLDAAIEIKLDQKVVGNQTVIAKTS
ncbi:MAG: phosphatidylserine decarboxylase family protein [Bacteroidia bacterium]|nr:phosphatidylserine decarboxylase family protein [Bacteroidia bacterium]